MGLAATGRRFLSSGIVAAVCLPLLATAADGKAVYDKTCSACHASGVANAPKFGDKAAWAPRIAAGKDAMLSAAMKGKGAMPPKGGAPKLGESDIRAAIDYMVAAAQ